MRAHDVHCQRHRTTCSVQIEMIVCVKRDTAHKLGQARWITLLSGTHGEEETKQQQQKERKWETDNNNKKRENERQTTQVWVCFEGLMLKILCLEVIIRHLVKRQTDTAKEREREAKKGREREREREREKEREERERDTHSDREKDKAREIETDKQGEGERERENKHNEREVINWTRVNNQSVITGFLPTKTVLNICQASRAGETRKTFSHFHCTPSSFLTCRTIGPTWPAGWSAQPGLQDDHPNLPAG